MNWNQRGWGRRLRPLVPVLFGSLMLLAAGRPAGAHMDLNNPEVFGRDPRSLYANREPNIFTHNVGLLSLQITNIGIVGNPFIDELSAGWRGGEYLYLAGLWIGAIGEDQEAHVSTAVPLELRPSLLPIDTIYESYEGIRGGNRDTEALDGDDDGDGQENEDFQNGKDDDNDGQIDEDYVAIGQQMFSCEYRDNTPEATNQISDHRALGLLIRQRSFQWATQGINEFVGLDYEVVNIGDQRLTNVYLGFFADADAGPKLTSNYWSDDLVGFVRVDSLVPNPNKAGQCAIDKLSMDIAYVYDAPDNGTTINGGDVPGYFGGMFLGHTTDPAGVKAPFRVGLTTVKWTASTGAYPQGDPRTDAERYDLLSRGEIPNRNANKPDDYRFTYAVGPFLQLDPGDKLDFQTAFVIGEGLSGMIQNAIGAQRVFNGQYVDADKNPETGIDGKERCLIVLERGQEVTWDDPCDTLVTTIRLTTLNQCFYVDDDCNPCTGTDGKEKLLNWVGTTAPPPPVVNTDPELQAPDSPNSQLFLERPGGDRRVVVQWDNLSELRPDPITGKNLFEGYRVWRVDGWQRPEGSIGPTPDQWMLVAEYRKNPKKPRPPNEELREDDLRRVRRPDRSDVRQLTPNGPQYFVGRYEWADSNGITNGKVYFYAVTAFGIQTRTNPATGLPEQLELGGTPAAVQKELVVASWQPGQGCSQVKVVPNPYRGGADWDLQPSDCDPTGTKVAFRNLPEGWTRMGIYTLTGDLVIEVDPGKTRVVGVCDVGDGNKQKGTFYWDLISRSGQNIVSGVYLYVVETPHDTCRGRFVVIR